MTILIISLLTFTYLFYKLAPRSRSRQGYYSTELDRCMNKNLEKFSYDIKLMNAALTENHQLDPSYLTTKSNAQDDKDHLIDPLDYEHFFLPYTGNGYLGLSMKSKLGIFVNFHKNLNLQLYFNPLVDVYSDRLTKIESAVTDFKRGMVHLIQCFQSEVDCFTVQKSLYVHRTRPSLIVEEITLNNPTTDPVTFDILQVGESNWQHSKSRIENIDREEFTITSGMVDVTVDHKVKHLCLSIGTTRLPITTYVKEKELFKRYTVLTVVKYSSALLSGKPENLDPILSDLESQVTREIAEAMNVGFSQLKKEHVNAWEDIWSTGFGISNSLATGAMNGNQLNGSIYYLLTNNRAPLYEVKHALTQNSSIVEGSLPYSVERCYEGFSTLHAVKLWKMPTNEMEVADLNHLWSLTLGKHGCSSLLELGATGILQAVVLSLGGFKFTPHHLDLNMNPRQLHRDYQFRNINYANLSLMSIDVEVGYDNHAVLYVTLNQLIDKKQKFYACDAGCIDPPIELELNTRQQFPVKMTSPVTAILYISSDKKHIDELKHTLHVQEVDIAPPQDVNSIAIHKHGHHMAGFAALFWTIFISLIIIFHLFLIKLVYRELCQNQSGSDTNYSRSYRKSRYARTV